MAPDYRTTLAGSGGSVAWATLRLRGCLLAVPTGAQRRPRYATRERVSLPLRA
jgi:hypothetical protein